MDKGKLQILDNGLAAYCHACKTYHLFDSRWTHNGDFDKPSFTPSMHVNADQHDACHSFLTDGVWNYCADSKHGYAGRSLALAWEDDPWHVLPINDLREHDENKDGICWCNPTIKKEDNERTITHNSADGREYLESLDLKIGDIPNHLGLVAKYWLLHSNTDDLNVAIALKWLEKRNLSLKLLGIDDAEIAALVNYFDSFLSNLLDGDDAK